MIGVESDFSDFLYFIFSSKKIFFNPGAVLLHFYLLFVYSFIFKFLNLSVCEMFSNFTSKKNQ